jgi:hypothetical protein
MKTSSKLDIPQLASSIEKLLHYLLPYTKHDIAVEVKYIHEVVYKANYAAPKCIAISQTLYTRIDDCHGAGNCCRIPYDLVFTDYCRSRIVNHNPQTAAEKYGKKSADVFMSNKQKLLDLLTPLKVTFTRRHDNHQWRSRLWVKMNRDVLPISGNKSCPFLYIDYDRYYCGVHTFKPLHCWYPHMTVRASRSKVLIGRNQYGRNHKFGCPVQFIRVDDEDMHKPQRVHTDYFDTQYNSDFMKLKWTSDAAASMGFTGDTNFAVGLHLSFVDRINQIRSCIASHNYPQLVLWGDNQ